MKSLLSDNLVGRAALFRQLAVAEDAGMTPQKTMLVLQRAVTPALRARIERARQHLHAGSEPSDALHNSGLCQFWESQFLRAMYQGGRLGEGYGYLSRQLEARGLRERRLKARLALPLAVFTLALFIAPLPALARGELDGWGYFMRTLLPLGLLAALFKLLGRLLHHENLAIPLLARLPGFGRLVRRQQELHCLAVLGLLLRSGLPASRALELAATAGACWPAAGVRRAVAATAQGASLADTLSTQGLCSDTHDRALIASGEAAGKLDDTLDHIARLRQTELDLKLDHWSEWLPRVLYFGAIIVWLLLRQGGLSFARLD